MKNQLWLVRALKFGVCPAVNLTWLMYQCFIYLAGGTLNCWIAEFSYTLTDDHRPQVAPWWYLDTNNICLTFVYFFHTPNLFSVSFITSVFSHLPSCPRPASLLSVHDITSESLRKKSDYYRLPQQPHLPISQHLPLCYLLPLLLLNTEIPSWLLGLSRSLSGKESACQCRNHRRWGFNPWVRKILWSRKL